MMSESNQSALALLPRARRAYELGRVQAGLLRGSLLATSTALLGTLLVDRRAFFCAPLTLALWTLVYWRGGVLQAAARYGLLAGAITSLFPMSLLRPCCRPGLDGSLPTCTMPEMCVLAGALVGLPLAAWVLRKHAQRSLEAASGMALGVLSLATLKCSALFLGEALGLLGGIALAIGAATALYGLRGAKRAL